MYGAEHGFLLHTVLTIGGWLVFLAICAAPLAIVGLAFWLGIRRGRRLERERLTGPDARVAGPASS